MRAALDVYYSIYNEAFKKRVVNEGIWLPFTAMRSIPGWEDFGFAFHETSWGSSDLKDGVKVPNIISDRGTGVLSFQYTEPWDVQIPIKSKTIPYIPLINEISAAGWEPVTAAKTKTENVRIERFGEGKRFYFTIRNNGVEVAKCDLHIDLEELNINGSLTAYEIVNGKSAKVSSNQITVEVPAGRTRVLRIEAE
jgi:hypothetical protein